MEKKLPLTHVLIALVTLLVIVAIIVVITVDFGPSDIDAPPDARDVEPGQRHTIDQLDPDAEPLHDPLGKFEPEIDVSTIHAATDGAFWFPEGDDINNNIYTRIVRETLGINYSFMWVSPSAHSAERFNVMLAADELPDMLAVSREQFEQLYRADMLHDLTDYLVEYASKFTKKYLTGDYRPILNSVIRDGRAYGIPNAFSYHDTGNMIWIRADWLENLNLELPRNFAQLEEIMYAFTFDDPDQDGVDDTYAIAAKSFVAYNEFGMHNAFFNMFGVYPGQWIMDNDGRLQDGMFGKGQRERTQEALLKLSEYYERGFVHPEFFTFDDSRYHREILDDKTGIFFHDLWAAYWPLVLHKELNPEVDWIPVALPGVEGRPANSGTSPFLINNINVVTKGFEHPEALVKMCNLFHDLNNNPETMRFAEFNTQPVDGNQIFLSFPFLIYNPSFNYEGFLAISEDMRTGSVEGLSEAYMIFHDQAIAYRETGDTKGWSAYRSYGSEGSLAVVADYIQNKRFKMNEFTGMPTEFQLQNWSAVKKLYDQMFIEVVTGTVNVNAFEQFINKFDEIYYDTVNKEINEWFAGQGRRSLQEWFDSK